MILDVGFYLFFPGLFIQGLGFVIMGCILKMIDIGPLAKKIVFTLVAPIAMYCITAVMDSMDKSGLFSIFEKPALLCSSILILLVSYIIIWRSDDILEPS